MEKSIRLPEKLKELSPETGEESNAYLVTFMCGTTPCINLAIAKTKEKVKEYFANILNVKESDFISIRLATEDDKRPGIPVHHIPEYPYVLHIEYSWGDQEPDQKFSTKKDAWDKAMSMAMTEADTASDEKEDGTAEIIKSGYCPDCQKALFGTEYDRSDFIIVDDIEDGEVPEDVKKFLEAAEKMNVKDVIKSETANILTTEHKVVLLSEFDLEDIFYVDDDGNIKDR